MFSTGKIIFAIIFFIAFVFVVKIAYKKDKNLHTKHYRGTLWILVGIIAFVAVLFTLKSILSR